MTADEPRTVVKSLSCEFNSTSEIVDFTRRRVELSRGEGNCIFSFNAVRPIGIVKYPEIVIGAGGLVSGVAGHFSHIGAIDIGEHIDHKVRWRAAPTIDRSPLLKCGLYDISHLIGGDFTVNQSLGADGRRNAGIRPGNRRPQGVTGARRHCAVGRRILPVAGSGTAVG